MPFLAQIDWSRAIDGYEIWYATLGALLGAGVAILFLKHQNRQRKYFAKKAIADRLHFNVERATDMLSWFAKGGIPNFLFDITGIVIWLTLATDILDDQLIKDISWHRYQLDHLNAKLSVYYTTTALSPICLDASKTEEMKVSILEHLQLVISGTCELEQKLLIQ